MKIERERAKTKEAKEEEAEAEDWALVTNFSLNLTEQLTKTDKVQSTNSFFFAHLLLFYSSFSCAKVFPFSSFCVSCSL